MVQKIEHDTRGAVEFLKRWNSDGPWVLTAIVPDGRIETTSFSPAAWVDAAQWVEERQGIKNLYFHVNPVRKRLDNKASKEDIAALAWLHVDIDPRVGEDFHEERERALRMLNEYTPKPTVIIDSGGGYQGFWKLEEDDRLLIDGNVSRAQELEAYNVQLEKVFQADHCHNVDRIMRLPGTVNVPNKKKIKKGRTPALATLVAWNEGAVYPLSNFTPAVRVQHGTGGLAGGQPKVRITGNVPDIGNDDLIAWAAENGKAIKDSTLALIATGQDPLDPTKYGSRSEVLFRVCCDLVRADVPDEMIFGVITGSNEIAKSVKDKPNWEAYALRQIERAKEDAVDPMLRLLNEKHAVIADIGGKCRIISEVMDPVLKRTRISKQSFDDFRNRYRHIKVTVGFSENGQPIQKAAGSWWVDHPQRRQYETIVFAPGSEIEDAYNLWRGFAVDALPGTRHESFLHHLRDNLCSGNLQHFNYLVGWMARAVQHPDSPGEVAVVLRGKRGTGKSFFSKTFGSLFGRHYLQVSDSKHLVGAFNAHLRDTIILFGDEAFFAGDKKHESVLKTLITEEQIIIEGKGVDAEASPNYVHLILASNDEWVVPAGLDERRFFAIDVGEGHKQDHSYFKRIKEDLDNGGRSNLLHYLLTYDLNDYEVRLAPQTMALLDQKVLSMSPESQWFYEKLSEGRLFRGESEWPESVIKDRLYDDYIGDMRDQGRNFRATRTAFGKFLQRAMPGEFPLTKQETRDVPWANEHGFEVHVKKRVYVCYLPTVTELRAHWDQHYGGPFDWPNLLGEQTDMTQVSSDEKPVF
ncbi:DNA primase [Stenotrophomonas phage Sonora]|nr:DNA primase [Stenotrophomonas phage Sonora]